MKFSILTECLFFSFRTFANETNEFSKRPNEIGFRNAGPASISHSIATGELTENMIDAYNYS